MTQSSSPQRVVVLGATGSIGAATLDVIARSPDRFELVGIAANRSVSALADLCRTHRPSRAVVADAAKGEELKEVLSGSGIKVGAGEDALVELATMPADIVVAAISGAAGLAPTVAAIRRGGRVAIANKECLVTAGTLVMEEARRAGATILPVDSEHNAIFQVFEDTAAEAVAEVVLTASGGPFRTWSKADMAAARPEQALKHPNWSMGAKITIDSATMMNKGLELIEAFHLFPITADQLSVVVHPQSIIHGMVRYVDGSCLAQLGTPDMRTPISNCLSWPARGPAGVEPLDLVKVGSLSFEAPDVDRFQCLALAQAALRRGEGAPTALNAANEVAVAAFLDGRIGFLEIAATIERVLNCAERDHMLVEPKSLDDVAGLDAYARRVGTDAIAGMAGTGA
ncbi:1-deoxy-D-xylulose-5-phosphate reductoisomerase [Amorphus orientalis]|uniref:1-deoxy-D-xylulose 5-phosphate reductoisomerase n=1 Tax=Amorphus orientalis TaxID=649198 RepID=A0AAE3VNY3_9HYPH|nr:1-deoxy-D-xylulose-5-phosphate reductoisomerase [Amorphus orientalis]MDQ0315548.1 1-deoxy-D-xylulose-5-phosphate reductoisomerase [Amorphus orientalis]